MKQTNRLLGGILLISGTTIGGAILALPVVTGLVGFIPSMILLFIYWIFTTYTAFLMLEVNLWFGEHVNLFTMAKNTLGKMGEIISCTAYLFLLYLLTTAYLAASGPIITDFIYLLTGVSLPVWTGALPLLAIFGFFVYEGTKYVDYANRLMMLGLIVTYLGMVVFITPHVQESLLLHMNWKNILLPVSLVSTSLGYHIIIPTLTTYMHRNISQLKKAILIGSLIPIFVYIFWEFISLGVIPLEGPYGVEQGYKQGANSVKLIQGILGVPFISAIANSFSFFAIVSSFLGVTLSLTDFLADGLDIQDSHKGRGMLFFLTFTPPLIFILTYPRAFLSALEYAGVFGVTVLLILLPALMVWAGRYHKHFQSTFKVPGGKLALIAVVIFSFIVIAIEIANITGALLRFTGIGT